MKKILIAAAIVLMSGAAFANDNATSAPDANDDSTVDMQLFSTDNSSEEATPDNPALTENTDDSMTTNAWRTRWTCRARDRFGRTFTGIGWDYRQAYREATWRCQRFTYRGGCFPAGCWQSNWNDGRPCWGRHCRDWGRRPCWGRHCDHRGGRGGRR